MDKVDLNEVAVFVQVVQAGSFSLAARQLGMPNSTVSTRISSLEKRLGATLLQRTTRKLSVTAAGEAYFRRCVQGLSELRAADEEIAVTHGEAQGPLRITAPIEIGESILPELIGRFVRQYPKVQVELILSDRVIDLVAEGIDVAIRAGALEDSTLRMRKLMSESFLVAAAPAYLKKKGSPTHPRDLARHECIHFTPLSDGVWQLERGAEKVSVKVHGRVSANEFNAIKKFVLAGHGIAMLPAFICQSEFKSGKLVSVLPKWNSVDRSSLNLVYPAQKFLSPKTEYFMEMTQAFFSSKCTQAKNPR